MPARSALIRASIGGIRSRVLRDAALYAAPSGVASLLAGISTALVARGLSTHSFGSFSFAVAFLLLAALVFDFGLALPAGRLAAQAGSEESRRIVGAYFLAFVPIGLAFVATVLVLSFGIDSWFHVYAGRALLYVAPLAFIFPFSYVSLWLAQGLGRPYAHALSIATGQVLFICSLVALTLTDSLTVARALALRAATMTIGFSVLVLWLRPAFRASLRHVPELVKQARAYGFQVYVGAVLSIGTYGMDVLMLGALTNARTVGLYALAGSIANASGLPVLGLSLTVFRRMVREGRLDRQWLAVAWAAGAVSVLLAVLLARPLINTIFSHRYEGAVRLVPVLAVAQAVRGVTGVYNSFLGSQALGKELRNAAVVLTASNLVFNVALIPPFGAMGAAVASLLALVANLFAHVAFYRRAVARPVTAS